MEQFQYISTYSTCVCVRAYMHVLEVQYFPELGISGYELAWCSTIQPLSWKWSNSNATVGTPASYSGGRES